MQHASQQIGFQEYLHSVIESSARIVRLEQALQAMRRVQLIAAMTLVAELQDFTRSESARKLMAYVGLVPGEHSSGPKRRQDQLPKGITDIACAAQLRLHAKFKRLLARRVMKTKAVGAVAREPTGFVWAIAGEMHNSGWQGLPPRSPCGRRSVQHLCLRGGMLLPLDKKKPYQRRR
jgi:hypothetical protein